MIYFNPNERLDYDTFKFQWTYKIYNIVRVPLTTTNKKLGFGLEQTCKNKQLGSCLPLTPMLYGLIKLFTV